MTQVPSSSDASAARFGSAPTSIASPAGATALPTGSAAAGVPPRAAAPGPARSARQTRKRFWIVTLAALLAFAAAISLGRWQLSRAAQKEALQASIDAQKTFPPLDMASFLAIENPAGEMHRRVRLRGLWLTAQSVWLDNRQMRNGTPGFYVLTPLALEGTQQTVMVQRGWVQRNFVDRTQLPPIVTPAGIVEVTGQIAPPPGHLLELGGKAGDPVAPTAPGASASTVAGSAGASTATAAGAVAATGAPAASGADAASRSSPIRQNLALDAYRAETALPLRTDVVLLQTGDASEGLQRDWPPPALGVERHYGYAFQWFGLALLVAILYVWFQFIAPRRRSR